MDDTLDRQVATIAARQHGLFTLAQAVAVGFTADQREYRARTGRWEVPYDRVYRIAGLPTSWRSSLLAACWVAQGLAVASHRSAAALRGLPGGRRDLFEITCHRWRRARPERVVVHETGLLSAGDIDVVDGVPTTSIEQTLLGLAAVLHPSTVEMAIDRALQHALTNLPALEQFIDLKGKQGRNGIGVLRSLVRQLDPRAGTPESPMETKLRQLLRRHGLPMPEFQYAINHLGRFVARVDAAYPSHRLAIEYDSYEHHTGKLALVRDTDRRNALLGIRWQTIGFTAADLARDGGPALRALRAALASSATTP